MEDASTTMGIHASQNLTCTTCHNDEEGLAAVHADVSSTDGDVKKLKSTTVSSETCLTCHDQDELIAATAELTILTDSKGTTVNPHELPANDAHAQIACGDCHTMHASADVDETAKKECLDCHHANVYECNTCHE